jgi:hypothetical protein
MSRSSAISRRFDRTTTRRTVATVVEPDADRPTYRSYERFHYDRYGHLVAEVDQQMANKLEVIRAATLFGWRS